MVESLMKICGALFLGGIGFSLLVFCTILVYIILKEIIDRV
jgi:hypothetical protein